jgi:hypothetical protein
VSAGGAVAGEVVLVHDIAPPHPRYTQLAQMQAEVARRTHGMLTIAINPGGKALYPGQASLDAAQNKTGINAQPITYTHNGRQYVTVLSGLGGGTSAKRETEGKVLPGGSVWTFALMPD